MDPLHVGGLAVVAALLGVGGTYLVVRRLSPPGPTRATRPSTPKPPAAPRPAAPN
ncbi:hypothetical protein [Frigoriglobus tundricola]|uniref:Uncharacterized protein n=1 Tax=Frigoriglobus tundricola TaxID=2774151 RepID=A0A6M5Z266_9BACT|nr:hypothetical protein [Frigoriglobus tundricola]QJX00490.1 hypothetical protein FTUN_8120 [Frigoriglobus tundricola]